MPTVHIEKEGSTALGLVTVAEAVFPWSPLSRVQGPLNLPVLCLETSWSRFTC